MFPTTHWTQLAQASLNGNTAGRHALEELCKRYWVPVRQFIRSRGRTEEEAEDLTQDFMIFLLQHSAFKRADRLRGRFRSLLLKALVWFLADDWDKSNAGKRAGRYVHFNIDGDLGDMDAALAIPPAEAAQFDRSWALTVLKGAWNSVHREYEDAGRAEAFAVLKRFLPSASEPPSYEEAAALLGISTGALSSEIYRMRGRIREHARLEVARTVSAPHEIEAEMTHLRHLLEDRGTDFCTLAASQGGEILRRV